MKHELMKLPFTSLEPLMSNETLEYHHGKHHNTYVTNLNNLIVGTEFENMSLEDIIKKSGSWFSYDGTNLAQGLDSTVDVLNDNLELKDIIELKIKNDDI